MAELKIPVERTVIALENKRDVNLTMPWFASKSRYPPRAANVVQPLINGQRAFEAVHNAINAATKSIDIISWGLDPSMRLLRPGGERLGTLLEQRARAGVSVRMLAWKNALANLKENNIIGDGLAGSGGGSAGAGSGVGSTAPGNAGAQGADGFNGYGSAKSGSNSGAVQFDDPEARAYNRGWFAKSTPNLSFRTRDFGPIDRESIAINQISKHGFGGVKQRVALKFFPSHHQKMLLIDYELPEQAVGFVMGHNLLRDYWDTDTHEYESSLRLGFAPWQDLSSRVYGPVLFDLNDNFCTAWGRAQPWFGSDQPISSARLQIKPTVFEAPAARHGAGEMAQICRTQSQDGDQSILESYKLALSNARNYVYFENQYFRNTELAMQLRTMRRKLKAGGWTRDFYVFVVTNVPEDSGRLTTYEMLNALGQSDHMPKVDKSAQDASPDSADIRALRRKDLEGMSIVVCTLCASGQQFFESKGYETGGVGAMGFPAVAFTEPYAKTIYKNIYVHSKLLLVDDVFFTIGSANINVRSMEVDSELNISVPSPAITTEWRKRLWKLHTGREPGDSMKNEFDDWQYIIRQNGQAKTEGKALNSSLIEFYDDASSGSRAD